MHAGHGIRHEEFMVNTFAVLGPVDDPADIRNCDPIEAMRKLAGGRCRFVSRGDDSGTHMREKSLWEAAGGRPAWDEYYETGQGMGPTLKMADEKQAYVLADMGTYLKFRHKVELVPLVTGADSSLRNPYSAIVVNPAGRPHSDTSLADGFVDFLISEEAQRLIAAYRVSGRPLFYPTRLGDMD
jgi:tungstate transport system substrate-binding protein